MSKSLTNSPRQNSDESRPVEHHKNYDRYSRVLGKGAYKTVYYSHDTEEGKVVAWNQIKVGKLVGHTGDKLLREINLLMEIKNHRIIDLMSCWFDEEKNLIVFITELMTSGTLREYVSKAGKLGTAVIKKWCVQILEGLDHLHSHEPPIIHRDIKCDNIFVDGKTGNVKIGDLGTPQFMAPEMYDEKYDEKVDVYAFGMCVLEMVTGKYPYSECESAGQIFKKVALGVPPKELNEIKDQKIKNFIISCLLPVKRRPGVKELLNGKFLQDHVTKIENYSETETATATATASENESDTATITETGTITGTDSDSETETATATITGSGSGSGTKTDNENNSETETETETATATATETETETESEPEQDTESESNSENDQEKEKNANTQTKQDNNKSTNLTNPKMTNLQKSLQSTILFIKVTIQFQERVKKTIHQIELKRFSPKQEAEKLTKKLSINSGFKSSLSKFLQRIVEKFLQKDSNQSPQSINVIRKVDTNKGRVSFHFQIKSVKETFVGNNLSTTDQKYFHQDKMENGLSKVQLNNAKKGSNTSKASNNKLKKSSNIQNQITIPNTNNKKRNVRNKHRNESIIDPIDLTFLNLNKIMTSPQNNLKNLNIKNQKKTFQKNNLENLTNNNNLNLQSLNNNKMVSNKSNLTNLQNTTKNNMSNNNSGIGDINSKNNNGNNSNNNKSTIQTTVITKTSVLIPEFENLTSLSNQNIHFKNSNLMDNTNSQKVEITNKVDNKILD
ncbi:wnk kinase [Anaeramoeba flamelloides]|uniref:Wnk kinase n=1 Tax=Anaeramoeba flamelloides TaxID=1746091 RepID=A0ABQ8XLV1_9EUKA|nr:wnk kinase [Anaeramoeba flamelloides]